MKFDGCLIGLYIRDGNYPDELTVRRKSFMVY